MITINHKIFLGSLAALALGAGVVTYSASAQTPPISSTSLVQKIAARFNLKEAEVQAVFDQEHAARHADMQKRMDERLTSLVTEGKLTEAQKQLILAKHAELQSAREANKDTFSGLSMAERKAEHDKHRAELEAWATQNGIDLTYLWPTGRHEFKGGYGMHWK